MISVDPISKIKCGFLYNAIVYRRRKNRRTRQSVMNISMSNLTEDQKDGIKNFFKTCRLPQAKDNVKNTMAQYKDYRMDLILNSFDEYKEIWSFYFVCPDLVRLFSIVVIRENRCINIYF